MSNDIHLNQQKKSCFVKRLIIEAKKKKKLRMGCMCINREKKSVYYNYTTVLNSSHNFGKEVQHFQF